MRRLELVLASFALLFCASASPAVAQSPESVPTSRGEAVIKQRKNAWTIGLATGLMEGTVLRFGAEMAKVLDDGDNLRVIPMVTYGAAGNLDDLLYLRGVDVAFTQADVFEHYLKERKTPNLQNRVHYIMAFHGSEAHVLVRKSVRSLEELRGRKVNFNTVGSAASMSGPIIFDRLKIDVKPLFINNAIALEQLKSGEIDALVHVTGKPNNVFTKLPENSEFHFLPVPFLKNMSILEQYYTLGELTNKDYPNLIPPGTSIETISVPSALAVYNWPKDSERYRRMERFVDSLFNKWEKFHQEGFHPKWKELNLAATVPGWTRFAASEQVLRRLETGEKDDLRRNFETFVRQTGRIPQSDSERDTLFREFMTWKKKSVN